MRSEIPDSLINQTLHLVDFLDHEDQLDWVHSSYRLRKKESWSRIRLVKDEGLKKEEIHWLHFSQLSLESSKFSFSSCHVHQLRLSRLSIQGLFTIIGRLDLRTQIDRSRFRWWKWGLRTTSSDDGSTIIRMVRGRGHDQRNLDEWDPIKKRKGM